MLDLTPFGFTATESAAYSALLVLGPSSGYAVAKQISIARANGYQALDGLVSKGLATLAGEEPRLYRPVSPEGVLARLSQDQSARLDALEAQIAALEPTGDATTVYWTGERRLEELVLRTAARSDAVRCAGPSTLLRRLVPVWRKRAQDGAPTELHPIGQGADDFPLPVGDAVDAQNVRTRFHGRLPFLLLTESAAIAGLAEPEPGGFWSSDPLLRGLVQSALEFL